MTASWGTGTGSSPKDTLKLSRPRVTRQFSFSIQMVQNLDISVENGAEMFELYE